MHPKWWKLPISLRLGCFNRENSRNFPCNFDCFLSLCLFIALFLYIFLFFQSQYLTKKSWTNLYQAPNIVLQYLNGRISGARLFAAGFEHSRSCDLSLATYWLEALDLKQFSTWKTPSFSTAKKSPSFWSSTKSNAKIQCLP